MSKPERLHDLDAMRSVLMMLGIVLHGANPYRTGSKWLIVDQATVYFLNPVVEVIHFFRMPAFFAVAGYFGGYLLTRLPVRQFLRERLTRLLIPCIVALFLLNIPQTWLLFRPGSAAGFARVLDSEWSSGGLVGHLWFLPTLTLHCILLAMCARPARAILSSSLPARIGRPANLFLLCVGSAIVLTGISALATLGPTWLTRPAAGIIDPVDFLSYGVFFIVGLTLHGSRETLANFGRLSAAEWLLVVGLVGLVNLDLGHRDAVRVVQVAATWLLMLYSVRLCFGFFRRWAAGGTPAWRYLSDASYTVYLFHHLLVILLASLLLGTAWPVMLKFAFVVTVTSIVTLGIHQYVILRSPTLRLLFNGKLRTKASG